MNYGQSVHGKTTQRLEPRLNIFMRWLQCWSYFLIPSCSSSLCYTTLFLLFILHTALIKWFKMILKCNNLLLRVANKAVIVQFFPTSKCGAIANSIRKYLGTLCNNTVVAWVLNAGVTLSCRNFKNVWQLIERACWLIASASRWFNRCNFWVVILVLRIS